MSTPDGDDGYDGPAEIADGSGVTVPVQVTLRGHFDPISGAYHWYGRVRPDPRADLADLADLPGRDGQLRLRTPYGETVTTLSDVDPWGRPRVAGFGAPPFPVADAVSGHGDAE
jgi:hypothetical protein